MMSKKIVYIILPAILLLAGACHKETRNSGVHKLYGEADTVSIEFGLNLVSATKGIVNETLVEDINLYVVNALGDVVSSGYYTNLTSLDLAIYSEMLYTVYAIANAGYEVELSSASGIEDFAFVDNHVQEIGSDGAGVLMSGKTEPQKLSDGQLIQIDLTRCVSKVVFQCDFSGLNPDVAIEVNSVQLKNIPTFVNLFKESKVISAEDATSSAAVISPSVSDLQSGITFYCYENMQGTLLPDNESQSGKHFDSESLYCGICSYMEIAASYSSPRKKGGIVYKFYCGKDVTSNFDLPRNHQQTITVYFTGDGAVEENTWRVDNSAIVDLVTSVSIIPDTYTFSALGEELQLSASILPLTAENKALEFDSSDESVASVDERGKVTSTGSGECIITATSCDGTCISDSCFVAVDIKAPDTPQIAFEEEGRVMYDGEIITVPYTRLVQTNSGIEFSLSNQNAEILSDDGNSITVRAIEPGTCIITTGTASASETYILDIQKLSIVPAFSELTLYNGFYDDISYTVTPSHAAGLKVNIAASDTNIGVNYGDVENRIMPQYDIADPLSPANATITLSIEGREDVSAEINATIKPSINILQDSVELITAVSGDYVKTLEIETHSRAVLDHEWVVNAKSLKFSTSSRKITLSTPTYDNGEYLLQVSVTADSGEVYSDLCNVLVSETVWLIGYAGSSSAVRKSNTASNVYIYNYTNDIMGTYTAHPDSKHFDDGVVEYSGEFSYNGNTGTTSKPVATETHEIEFRIGETYQYIFDSGELTFKGSVVPRYYLCFYRLVPIGGTLKKFENRRGEIIRCRIESAYFTEKGLSDSILVWQEVLDNLFI